MSYFRPGFKTFFKELSKNNNKEWFDENRNTYKKEVKEPFSKFIEEMIHRIQQFEPEINIKPSDAIMRINKDVRFSNDKTPYKVNVSANISVYGKKDKSYPGIYFQLSHDKIEIYGGAYMMDTSTLSKVRNYISDNLLDFSHAYNDKSFKEKYKSIQGEKHKRIPKELEAAVAKEPLIMNKQFYYSAEIGSELLTKDELPDRLMEYYLAGKKLNDFLRTALIN